LLTHTLKSSLGTREHYMSNDDRFNDTSTKINILMTSLKEEKNEF
jgi:hypothetical protein